MSIIHFLDTSAALILQDDIFALENPHICHYTFKELEDIKSSNNKSDDIKAKARRLIHLLSVRQADYTIVNYRHSDYEDFLRAFDLSNSPDMKILSCAYQVSLPSDNEVIFTTADLFQCKIAERFMETFYVAAPPEDEYKGYQTWHLNDESIDLSYQMIQENDNSTFNLCLNQYLLFYHVDQKDYIDAFKWCGDAFRRVEYPVFYSDHFGEIKPKNIHQKLAMDSMKNNQITLIGGPAGSGKTWLSLGYLFDQLEHYMIDRIVIFCNPVVAKNAAKLGLIG